MEEERLGLVLMLLREGSEGHAIRVYQEEAGVTFGKARQAVHELAGRHGIRTGRRHELVSFCLVVLAGLVGLLLAY